MKDAFAITNRGKGPIVLQPYTQAAIDWIRVHCPNAPKAFGGSSVVLFTSNSEYVLKAMAHDGLKVISVQW